MANKKNQRRPGKRKYRGDGNKKTVEATASTSEIQSETFMEDISEPCSTSAKKIRKSLSCDDTDSESFFFFMHFRQLKLIFEQYSSCKRCASTMTLFMMSPNEWDFPFQ